MSKSYEIGHTEPSGYGWEIKHDMPTGLEVHVLIPGGEISEETIKDGRVFAKDLAALIGELNEKREIETEFVI